MDDNDFKFTERVAKLIREELRHDPEQPMSEEWARQHAQLEPDKDTYFDPEDMGDESGEGE